jgi:predicted nucleic acid-binding protein
MELSPTADPVNVFIDSTILVAAAISASGPARELLLRGIRNQLILILSSLVLEETERNLRKKAPAALPAFALLCEALDLEPIDPPAALVVSVAKLVEPKDAPIVAGALHCRAQFLATHDRRHLLSQQVQIKAEFGIDVVSPGDLLRVVRP